MSRRFQELAFTRLVKEHQKEHGSRRQYERMEQSAPQGDRLGPAEQDFIQRRDSFYMASVSETGWPYVQHRGGLKGFVRVIDPDSSASQIFAATSNTSAWEIWNTTPAWPSSSWTTPTRPASKS
jgi:hypothetical protein